MTDITLTLDGIHGEVKFVVTHKDETKNLRFRWYKADDGSTGFVSNINKNLIEVTELAAEMMIKIITASLIRSFEAIPGSVKVFNHLGEQLSEIEFMPPTFDGKESDIQKFVAQQDSLRNLYASYEDDHRLSSDLLAACEQSGVLDDFLSLIQFQLSNIAFTFSNVQE
jgi:hypothetical protein